MDDDLTMEAEEEEEEEEEDVMETGSSNKPSPNSTTMAPADDDDDDEHKDGNDIIMDEDESVDNISIDDGNKEFSMIDAGTTMAQAGEPVEEEVIMEDTATSRQAATAAGKDVPMQESHAVEEDSNANPASKDKHIENEVNHEGPQKDNTISVAAADEDSTKQALKVESEISLSLHEYLSLGEIELGLAKHLQQDRDIDKLSKDTSLHHVIAMEEIQRLPYLLRMLSKTRSLATVSTIFNDSSNTNINANDSLNENKENVNKKKPDLVTNEVVDRLEDVAAKYSIAEAIDVVTNHLVPTMTRKLSRLPTLKKVYIQIDDGDNENNVNIEQKWDTKALVEGARDPISLPIKKRRMTKEQSTGQTNAEANEADVPDEDVLLSSDGEAPTGRNEEETGSETSKKRNLHRRDSLEVAAEDSQEATVTKTLTDLISLVVSSLDKNGTSHRQSNSSSEKEHVDDQQRAGTGNVSFGLSLTMDDSILSESGQGADEGTGGAMEGSDLGSTIASIMHHCPVVQSRHVSNAFCRATLDQTPGLMTRMGANCPASVPSLLLGCCEAYSMAVSHGNKTIANTAKLGVMALASLSRNERSRVLCKLQSLNIMFGVQLQLSMEIGLLSVSCLLLRHLTFLSPKQDEAANSFLEETRLPQESLLKNYSTDIPHRETEGSAEELNTSENNKTLLQDLLETPSLYERVVAFFSKQFIVSRESIEKSIGKWTTCMRAFAMLLLVPIPEKGILKLTQGFFTTVYGNFIAFCQGIKPVGLEQYDNEPESCRLDTLLKIASSCSILLLSRIDKDVREHIVDGSISSTSSLKEFARFRNFSRHLSEFWLMIDCAFDMSNLGLLFNTILDPLDTSSSMIAENYRRKSFKSLETGLQRMCSMTRRAVIGKEFDEKMDDISKVSVLLQSLTDENNVDEERTLQTSKLLKSLLESKNGLQADTVLKNIDCMQFVVEGNKYLSKASDHVIPFVLPTALDVAWSKISSNWSNTDQAAIDKNQCIFLLQFFYAFEFLEAQPASPFSIDPRSFPVKEALHLALRLTSRTVKSFVVSELERLTGKFCPEIYTRFINEDLHVGSMCPVGSMTRTACLQALHSSIRSLIDFFSEKAKDSSNVESTFLQARYRLCDSDLYCAITSALLSSPHNPSPSYSYYLLCRDPVVIFKSPLAVWRKKELRRIALNALSALILTNNAIIFEESPTEESAEELIIARDAIIFRCLLSVLRGEVSKTCCTCSISTNFLRWLLQNRYGLTALLVKQGLEENDLDWLIENVPETMNNPKTLSQILSERSLLTAAERLVAADAIGRIAIVHGDPDETEAAQLALKVVNQLVDSFYLIIGPVGVPVNALLNDDSGADITQISRKAAFRILKSLTRVRGRRGQFTCCGIALQKFANLCKGESAVPGVSGSVATRRKQLLRELHDTAAKAVGISGQI